MKRSIPNVFERIFIEAEPTSPGGGRMRYRVEVEPPNREVGGVCAFICVSEESFDDSPGSDTLYDADRMLLDINSATFIRDALTEAIELTRRLTEEAKHDEDLAKRG